MNIHLDSYLDLDIFKEMLQYEIYKYLSPVDIYKIDPKLFDKCLLFHINRRLSSVFRDRFGQLKKTFNEQNIVISGSLILQCILGEQWDSDIDIFTNKCNYDPNNDFRFDYMKLLVDKRIDGFNIDYLNDLKTMDIEDYLLSEHKIQVIGLNIDGNTGDKHQNIEDIWNYIQKDFDFDVCANIYYIENNIEKIRISNIDDILKKQIKLDGKNRFVRPWRIETYKSRGFTIDTNFDNKHLNRIKEILGEHKLRIYYNNKPDIIINGRLLPLGTYVFLFYLILIVLLNV